MGNAASVCRVCAARDEDYAEIAVALRACFPCDVAEVILDYFDWSYDTRFVYKETSPHDEIRTTTTIRIDIYRDATFSFHHTYMTRDDFDGETEVHETHSHGTYRIEHRRLVLAGRTTSARTCYKQTFDADGSMHMIRGKEFKMAYSRQDLCQYEKLRL